MSLLRGMRPLGFLAIVLMATTVIAGPLAPPPGPVQSTDRVRINAQDIVAYPYTITVSGSYVLTSNINVPSGSDGILIQTSGVTLDLNGFNIVGEFDCLNGVLVQPPGKGGELRDIAILNGIVRNCGGNGIDAFNTSNIRLDGIMADSNGQRGISVGNNASVRDCLSIFNSDLGISARENAVLENCAAMNNGSLGILTDNSSVLRGCTSEYNSGDGIASQSGSTLSGCAARFNFGLGISVFSSCTITDSTVEASFGTGIFGFEDNTITNCSVTSCNAHGIEMFDRTHITNTRVSGCGLNGIYFNTGTISGCTTRNNGGNGIDVFAGTANISDCVSSNNRGDGILLRDRSTVINCQCSDNGSFGGGISGAGINVIGEQCRIDGNHVTNNDQGIQATIPLLKNIIIRNSAMGNTDNYGSIDPANDVAPISSAAAAVSPWGNIEF